MAITTSLTWYIRDVDREISDGFIVHAAWELRGQSFNEAVGIASFRMEGDAKFPVNRTGSEIPFNDVEESKVVQWVKDSLGSDKVQWYEDRMHEILVDIHAKPNPGDGMKDGPPPGWDDIAFISTGTLVEAPDPF